MKNLFIAVLTFTLLISCGVEDVEQNEAQNIKTEADFQKSNDLKATKNSRSCFQLQKESKLNLSNRNSCTIINNDPFTAQTVTYQFICDNYPSYDCFDDELKQFIKVEFHDQFSLSPRFVSEEYVTSNQINLMLSDVIDTSNSNLYPFISATKANIVYEEIACQVIDHANTLPPLPQNHFYRINITFLQTDFTLCGGPTDSYTLVNYDIYDYRG